MNRTVFLFNFILITTALFSQTCIEGNCENGKGKWKQSNFVFDGFFENGKFKKGKLTDNDGTFYEGTWKDGKFLSGTGKLVYDNYSYTGEVITHENSISPHGNGSKNYNNGDYYKGIFKNGGFVTGTGKFYYSKESMFSYYEGELILNEGKIVPHGRGYRYYKEGKSKTGPDWTYGQPTQATINQSKIPTGKWAIDLKEKGKVFEVKGVITNGNHLLSKDFIFDTGASFVSLPWSTVVELINQKIITSKDFQGDVSLQTASGDVMEGKKFVLKEIYFDFKNDKGEIQKVNIYDVDAVVNSSETELIKSALGLSETPTLLGQSALRKFEKIEIDYRQNLLIINKEK